MSPDDGCFMFPLFNKVQLASDSVKTGDIWLWGDETDKEKIKSIGTRVLPLFVLSLDDVPYDLVLDNDGM